MKKLVCKVATVSAVLLASSGFVPFDSNGAKALNDRLFLSIAQEQAVFQIVDNQKARRAQAPRGFQAEIGQVLPTSIKLRNFPSDATTKVWAITSYSYVLLQDRLLIVNPQDRKVVDIITQ